VLGFLALTYLRRLIPKFKDNRCFLVEVVIAGCARSLKYISMFRDLPGYVWNNIGDSHKP
jgi:hypothetical protein